MTSPLPSLNFIGISSSTHWSSTTHLGKMSLSGRIVRRTMQRQEGRHVGDIHGTRRDVGKCRERQEREGARQGRCRWCVTNEFLSPETETE